MDMLGFITVSDKVEFKYIPKCLERFISGKMLDMLTINFKNVEYKIIEFPDLDIRVYISQLPFMKSQLNTIGYHITRQFCQEIIEDFKSKGIHHVILNKQLKVNRDIRKTIYENGEFYQCDGKELLIALTSEIYKKVCKMAGLKLSNVCVAIVEKFFSDKSLFIIKELSALMRYVTLVTSDMEQARNYLDRIYDDMGLAVWVSDDLSSALSNVDVIIVLDDFQAFIKKAKFRSSAIIFNLSTEVEFNKTMRNEIIDNLDIYASPTVKSIFSPLGEVSIDELLKCILTIKSNKSNQQSYMEKYLDLRRQFYGLGCKINALMGCGRVINIKAVKK